jgi:uncharacterized protein YukE
MVQLNQATKRLQEALDRLERAVDASVGNGTDDGGSAELRAALAAAQKQNAALQKAATTVATRLDTSISRFKSALEA